MPPIGPSARKRALVFLTAAALACPPPALAGEAPWIDFEKLAEPATWGLHHLGTESAPADGYDFDRFVGQAASVPWEFAAIVGGITAFGIARWDWGSSGFRFQSEGFFGEDTGSGGMDKLGHAWTSYLLTDFFTWRIRAGFEDAGGAEYTAAALSLGIMTYVEVLDGFSDDHGFSYEDMIANASGIAFSVLRNKIPGLAEKVDFRLEWFPSDWDRLSGPVTDYMGQKYVLAIKPAGFEGLKETPLRFGELHLGYYARGFKDADKSERERNLYVGVGLNLGEIYAAATGNDRSLPSQAIRTGLEYIQVPYTYVPVERRW